jgi:hypothetical protein
MGLLGLGAATLAAQDLLRDLGTYQDYRSLRVSSFDRRGGNDDRISIGPGESAVLADIEGPAAIHHIWVTIAGEPFYGRKIVLRIFWDGEAHPSVEAPIGDFFGVGHGLNRNLSALALACSSEGRARNCYWYMPFRKSARITVTNQGREEVGAFYFYIDYRKLAALPEETPYFHASYRQEVPCRPGRDYVILEAWGRGHYAGCQLSILQRSMGWWGEGDDIIQVDGEAIPSLRGTGSEDYFSDAWGMREDENLFYGCPLQEQDFRTGSKATVYRHHIPDPIPFRRSIRVAIEHGHANDRADFYSSTAYWYQSEPHGAYPPLPSVEDRLPFALALEGLVIPDWERRGESPTAAFVDRRSGLSVTAGRLTWAATSFYGPAGDRYPVLATDHARAGDELRICLPAPGEEFYNLQLFYLESPVMGEVRAERLERNGSSAPLDIPSIRGYAEEARIARLTIPDVRLRHGDNTLVFRMLGRGGEAAGEFGIVGLRAEPSRPRYVRDWNLVGPFHAPDMSYLQVPFPPEVRLDTMETYIGKDGRKIAWRRAESRPSGFVALQELFRPRERAVVYGLVYVFAPSERATQLLIGSDDGVRVWLNGKLVFSNPAYRGAYPDQDRIPVRLNRGWNPLLLKILQGAGGWGFYVRFLDPDGELRFDTEAR